MTAQEFRLPDLGEGLEDAEIAHWLVRVGDPVAVDQPVVEVVTAKATVELPAPVAGVVVALHGAAGDVVAVGAPLLSIGEAGDSIGEPADETGAPTEAAPAPSAPPAAPTAPAASRETGSGSVLVGYGTRPERRRRRAPVTAPTGAPPNGSVPLESDASTPARRPAVVSPVVRRLARELEVDVASIAGSGPDGVITRADVERAAAHGRATPAAARGLTPRPPADSGEERIVIRGAHRQMAERLARSRREIPEATVWVDADASGLLEARRLVDEAHPERPDRIGLTSWLARLCVLGLQRWPLLNARLEGDEIVVGREVHLGIALQTDAGLVVPVVHHADELSLVEIDDELRRLTGAARKGRLTTSDLTGGTCTLNNYGIFGVDGSAAIINVPEVAIVGVGRMLERPWVVEGQVLVRPVTELTLSFDHRVCDGGVAGGFLRFLADCVEAPARLLAL